ncbi:hypothetical protein BELL_0026g00030 [Botrytis elliptica]|uniref:Uncharacterized protein n=1 Tax=Botrytis elliptica TaxID=278938 RepID=A0A4Z1K6I8_9HELO|nr:hypothetical protein BELL_0026g00030 [Botrytis elliptica]
MPDHLQSPDSSRNKVLADAPCSHHKGSLVYFGRINADQDISRLTWNSLERVFNPVTVKYLTPWL